ncbi:MAG: ABC transporter ATP-binding protein/permease [Coprobacillus sp.]|nr:ABC transporter ATP-binding protein/permease [Coprobacillus sp.]MDY4145745.1 ABC transporter ATP-binding protein [Bacilli bacterium]
MKNYKRLFRLIKGHYRYLVISILMILLIQVLELVSPMLVKNVLDEGLSGVEYPWIEVLEEDEKTITFKNHYYKQYRHKDDNDVVIKDISVVIIKKNFYMIPEKVEEGTKELKDDKIIIANSKGTYYYDYVAIPSKEVKNFYNPIISILRLFIILIACKSIVMIIATYVQRICTNKVINHLAKEGRTIAFKSVERLPLSVFESEPAGKTASRITQDVDGLITLYRLLLNVFFNAMLSFVFAYIGMFILNPKLALLSFIIYPLAALWIFIYLKYLKKIAVKVNETRSLITAKINEIINGIQILQIFNFKKQTIDEFNVISKNYKDEQLKEVKLHIVGGWNLLNLVRGLVTTVIVLFFGLQKMNVAGIVITAGLIYAYNEYLLKIVNPISLFLNQISAFEHAHVQIDRIYTLIDGEQEDDTKIPIPRYQGNIKFEDVWFSYVKDEYVLKGVSFNIKAGTMVGLVGHTGSGKSSLMNLLLRFYDLDDKKGGHIYMDGVDIKTNSKRTYREHIGIVLQEPVLFRGTIASNIRFGKSDVTDKQIEDVLIAMGGQRLLDKFENGINQVITRSGNNMSSGEKQIIALARAIIQNPAVLIMDEATSHIDIETENIIKKGLQIACEGRTVIVIAHRLSTIFDADDIIVLDHGLKVEEGTHEELLRANGVYANIYRAQISSIE